MKKITFLLCAFLISGCSVLTAPLSWNAQPMVIDNDQSTYKAIIGASDHKALISQGDSIRTKIQTLISKSRKNLDRTSGGNYGAGLIAAAVGLSSLHSDALLGAGYLAGTHIALSNRLSPLGYLQQLQRTSNAFYCLNNTVLGYVSSAQKASNIVGFTASTQFFALGYSSDFNSYAETDFDKIKQTYLRALELSQEKLDSQISLTLPADVQNQLVNASKEAAKDEVEIEKLTDSDSIKDFLVEHEKLDSALLSCIALI
ncbi:hypothetical protein BB427_20795 [Pseudoalteromonas sp. BMB]|uniref:hypothetical protein n=1 Tax=Pseudoalteromonas sp. BMB TaxID=1874619 RepID=UPI00083DB48B|nr:hypothetical protein [Pseudoalteromonas sp. BMB]ODB33896.1 hypothetical protein BB427_20795 [Pseudoalteromonas sp. BMB]